MKVLAGLAGVVLGVLLSGGPAMAASATINMSASAYEPAAVHVNVNDDVFWCNPSDQDHTVHADDGSFIKDFPAHSQCSGRTFQIAGTFPYHCTIVPSMHGTITVGDGGSSPPPPPPPPRTSTTASRVTTTIKRVVTTTSVAHARTTATSAAASATAVPTEPIDAVTTLTTIVTTTTTSPLLAIKEKGGGTSNVGTMAALIATGVMALAGGGYFVYRLRAAR